jgi:DNA modification methylase
MTPRYRLIQGDCLDILPTLEAGSVDAVICDPPYGIKLASGFSDTGVAGIIPRKNTVRQYSGDWDSCRPSKAVFDYIAQSEVAIVFGGNYFADYLPKSGHWIVWDKQNTMPSFSDAELIWTNSLRNSVKIFTQSTNGLMAEEKNRVHPTQKPVRLLSWLIENYTKEGDTILDPFMGSGTTGVAAMRTGRNFIGIEMDAVYFAIAEERIKNAAGEIILTARERATGQMGLFGGDV